MQGKWSNKQVDCFSECGWIVLYVSSIDVFIFLFTNSQLVYVLMFFTGVLCVIV